MNKVTVFKRRQPGAYRDMRRDFGIKKMRDIQPQHFILNTFGHAYGVFLVLMSNVQQEHAVRMAERIQNKVLGLNIPHLFNAEVSTHVTVSAGLAALEDGNFIHALGQADVSLYNAKNSGRNKIFYAWEATEKPQTLSEEKLA